MFFTHTRPRCPRWMWNRPWAHIPEVSQTALAFPATAVEVLVWADAMVWRSAERARGPGLQSSWFSGKGLLHPQQIVASI